MALPITAELVSRAAQGLRDGGWRFSLRQLYYASCAEAEMPPSNAGANGEIALGTLLVLVALILIALRPLFAVLGGLGVLLILLGVAHRLTRRPVVGRVMSMSYAQFDEQYGALAIDGLLPGDAAPPSPAAGGMLVVCDSAETAAVVAANRDHAGLTAIVPVAAKDLPVLSPEQGVAVLHDASPRGCALPLELRDSGARVLDCGLRPGWVELGGVAGD